MCYERCAAFFISTVQYKLKIMIKHSVVVATYNRASLLKQCLEALARQTVPKNEYEILIINDGSRDNTDEVAKNFKESHQNLRFLYFKQDNSGPAKARNIGIKNAQGDIIFFTDDDCIVPPNWIETLAKEYILNPEIAGVGGWYKYDEKSYKSRLARAYINYMDMLFFDRSYSYWGINYKTQKIKSKHFFKNPAGNTSNMSYKKSVLIETGGFDETIKFVGYVDWELKKRIASLGYELVYLPHFVSHHKPLTVGDIMMKFFNRGRGRFHLVSKNPELLKYYSLSITTLKRKHYMPKVDFFVRIIMFIELVYGSLGWWYQNIQEKLQAKN